MTSDPAIWRLVTAQVPSRDWSGASRLRDGSLNTLAQVAEGCSRRYSVECKPLVESATLPVARPLSMIGRMSRWFALPEDVRRTQATQLPPTGHQATSSNWWPATVTVWTAPASSPGSFQPAVCVNLSKLTSLRGLDTSFVRTSARTVTGHVHGSVADAMDQPDDSYVEIEPTGRTLTAQRRVGSRGSGSSS
jgi:hypothetical protein